MKTLLTFTAITLAISTMAYNAPVFADNHGGKGAMFEKKDINGDGVISKAEFLKHAEEKFAKMDADGDGVLSKEEAKKKRKEMKDKLKDKMKDVNQ